MSQSVSTKSFVVGGLTSKMPWGATERTSKAAGGASSSWEWEEGSLPKKKINYKGLEGQLWMEEEDRGRRRRSKR